MQENMDVTQVRQMLFDMLSETEKEKFESLSVEKQDEFIKEALSQGGVAGLLINIRKKL